MHIYMYLLLLLLLIYDSKYIIPPHQARILLHETFIPCLYMIISTPKRGGVCVCVWIYFAICSLVYFLFSFSSQLFIS